MTLLKRLLNGEDSMSTWGGGMGYLDDPSPTPSTVDPARLKDQNTGDIGGIMSNIARKNGHPKC